MKFDLTILYCILYNVMKQRRNHYGGNGEDMIHDPPGKKYYSFHFNNRAIADVLSFTQPDSILENVQSDVKTNLFNDLIKIEKELINQYQNNFNICFGNKPPLERLSDLSTSANVHYFIVTDVTGVLVFFIKTVIYDHIIEIYEVCKKAN